MKKFIILSLFLALQIASYAGVIEIEGIFQGKNIYVMNPFSSSGVGFCVYEVSVNGQVTTDEINSSAFEIDFTALQLKLGSQILVEIKHKENCIPKVLNAEVLKPKSTFLVKLIDVQKDGTLNWTTQEEDGKLPFIVEQYRWNKWIKVNEITGNGTKTLNKYSTKVNLHSGENRFRVKQIDHSNSPRYSSEAFIKNLQPTVILTSTRVSNEIIFSASTMYEIYDYFGNLIKKGEGKIADISKLKKGKYFVNFDNQMSEIVKK
jgi:hypothetical protein